MSLNFEQIGKRIKKFRAQKSISQAELADRADLSVSYISYIETAKKHTSLEALVRIANALGVIVDYLLNGCQTNNPEYKTDMAWLLKDCNSGERRIIFEVALAIKKSLRG